jgi:exonuclease III
MSVNRTLYVCSFNLHGFKSGCNTASDLCKSYDLVLLQKHWLRKDNLPNLALLNEHFSYFGVSGMDEAACNGLLKGRPFGGVAILWNTTTVKKVKIVGSDPSGRCAAIKVVFVDYTLLVINVYLPCFTASADYIHELHEYLGYIESLLANEVYSDVIICGDFNFPLELHNAGYRSLSSLMSDYNVIHCDDLICNTARVSYVNSALGHSSLIDHFFVSNRLRRLIYNCDILSPVNNFSDHLPLLCVFNLDFNLSDIVFNGD